MRSSAVRSAGDDRGSAKLTLDGRASGPSTLGLPARGAHASRRTSATRLTMDVERNLQPVEVNVRIKVAALWASMLFTFAYVDLFSTYRADFRADLDAGKVSGLAVDQTFLLGTTVYVVLPSLMVFLALVLPPRVDRIANLVLSGAYVLTIVAGAIGEWSYYILGSAVEVALLAAVAYYAWTWPKEVAALPPSATDKTPQPAHAAATHAPHVREVG